MPFEYKPKKGSTRKKCTKQELEIAVQEVQNGASIRKTSIKYGIDRSTLRRYKINAQKVLQAMDEKGSQHKHSQIFTISEEKLLVEYLLTASKMNYGLTRKDAMKLAVQFGQSNSKKMPNSWLTNNIAGKDWFRGFLKRNPEISLRTPEATSLSRATSFNKKNVGDFFQNLKTVREKDKFEPHNIYNCDETGCTTVQKCPKVLASKKDRQVGQVTSAERGTLVTVCFAVNAIGNVIPPFFVFPRVKYRDDFVSSGPEGSDGDSHPSGWMTAKCFLKFMEHFQKHSRASKENRVLLILDNHESHVNIDVIKFAKENGITLLTLPPHCSNKLQPLDITVYSSLKSRYNTAMSNWMLSNPGKTVTIYHIPSFIKSIISQACSQSNILSGFKNSGIHPFDPEIFAEEDFMCSAVTDRKYIDGNLEKSSSSSQFSNSQVELKLTAGHVSTDCPDVDGPMELQQRDSVITPTSTAEVSPVIHLTNPPSSVVTPNSEQIPLTTSTVEVSAVIHLTVSPSSSVVAPTSEPILLHSPIPSTSRSGLDNNKSTIITPEMIKPYPKAAPRKATRGRQPGKTKILTLTPEKNDEIDPNPDSKNLKCKMDTKEKKVQRTKDKGVKRKVLQDSDSEQNTKNSKKQAIVSKGIPKKRKLKNKNKCQKKPTKAQNGRKKIIQISDSDSENENIVPYADTSDDENFGLDNCWYCFVCETEAVMDMRLCGSCKRYVHEACVGLTDKDVDNFICHEC